MAYQLGVDLGTTFTAAAVSRDGRAEAVTLGVSSTAIPSVLLLRDDGVILVGDAATRRAMSDPTRVAREFKRRLGDPAPLVLGGTPFGADALMGHLLRFVIELVTERQGEVPSSVVLTHPANYGPYKVDIMREVARQGGVLLPTLSLLAEPRAAALSYASRNRVDPGEVVAVYDFGGGTFDVAMVRRVNNDFELVGDPDGIERFGGIDIDAAILNFVDDALGGPLASMDTEDSEVRARMAQLVDECRAAKETLSADTEATITVSLPGVQSRVRLTRVELERMVAPRIRETVAALQRCVMSAGLTMADVSRILLVGGTSRIPLIGQVLRQETGRPIAVDAEPKLSIALGAATYRQWQPPANAPPPALPPQLPSSHDLPLAVSPAADDSPRAEQALTAAGETGASQPLPVERAAVAGPPRSFTTQPEPLHPVAAEPPQRPPVDHGFGAAHPDDAFIAAELASSGGGRRRTVITVGAALIVVALVVVGIVIATRKSGSKTAATNPSAASTSSSSPSTAQTTTAVAAATTAVSSTPATTTQPPPGDGTLQGFSALFPAAVPDQAFTDRVAAVNPAVQNFRYAAETYDAVIIASLAAVQANDDGMAFAAKINGITRGGTKCTTFVQCRDLIASGANPDYDGVSGPLEFAGNGEPTVGNYSQQVMGPNNRIDPTRTTLHDVTGPASADVAQIDPDGTRVGDGTFTIGALLPATGGDSVRGAAEIAAFDLAVQDVNAAGGVLAKPMVAIKADSADGTTDTIDTSVDSLLAQNVDVIVGPASTDLALKVMDKITAAGVAEIAPSTTFKVLSNQPDHGLFFRTVPSNTLEGTGLGVLVAAGGAKRVAIFTRNDDADNGMADDASAALGAAGVAIVTNQRYEPTTTTFDAQVAAVKASNPDAIIILDSNQLSVILEGLVKADLGPSSISTFATDFSFGDSVGQRFEAGT